MMAQQVDVSIIIPAHNRRDLLVQAIDSCHRSGPGLRLQIVVVDDASQEDIRQVSRGKGVVFERLDTNAGSGAARNRGLALSTGRYVKFLDSDDVLVDGSLALEYHAAEETGADIVVAGWVDTWLNSAGRETALSSHTAPRFSSIPDDLLAGKAVPTSAALYRGALARHTSWDPALAKLNDWDYFVTTALDASLIHAIDGPAYRWRQHGGVRITSSSTFSLNAHEFYVILDKLEAALTQRGQFTLPRQRRMAQYLFKELRGLYRFSQPARHQVLDKIMRLDPGFKPRDEERSRIFRLLFSLLPAGWVLWSYGAARRVLDRATAISP